MANATDIVNRGEVSRSDEYIKMGTETLAAETQFFTGAMIGLDATGYLCKGDDTQAWTFAGCVRGNEGDPKIPAGTAGADALKLDIHQKYRFVLAISGIAQTDVNKKVYALDDKTGTLSAAATTYANFIGHVVTVFASGYALVEPCYSGVAGNIKYGVAKSLAATGAQTLSKCDLGKTILIPNTGAYSITLPPVADTQAGDRLTFIKTTTDAAAATLDANASETIDGATTLATLDAAYDTAILVSTGTVWIVLARDIA